MLRLFWILIKCALFSIVIVVLANWIQWKGKTVSDQIKIQMAHAERTDLVTKVRTWTKNLADDATRGAMNKLEYEKKKLENQGAESIPPSEKQKLRSLIQDLNSYPHEN